MVRKQQPAEAGTAELCLLPAHLRNKTRLRPAEASIFLMAEYSLSYKPKTLAKLRCLGGGPPFFKVTNSILYPVAELRVWAESKIGRLQSSTSDTGEY